VFNPWLFLDVGRGPNRVPPQLVGQRHFASICRHKSLRVRVIEFNCGSSDARFDLVGIDPQSTEFLDPGFRVRLASLRIAPLMVVLLL